MLLDNLWVSVIYREASTYEKGETKIPAVCGKIQYSKILKCAGSLKSLVRDVYLCICIYVCVCNDV